MSGITAGELPGIDDVEPLLQAISNEAERRVALDAIAMHRLRRAEGELAEHLAATIPPVTVLLPETHKPSKQISRIYFDRSKPGYQRLRGEVQAIMPELSVDNAGRVATRLARGDGLPKETFLHQPNRGITFTGERREQLRSLPLPLLIFLARVTDTK